MSTHEQSHPGFTPHPEAGSDHVPAPDEAESVRRQRFKRARPPKPATTDSRQESTAILAELMLLREENAWLKAAQHQAPGIGQAIQRVRALPSDERGSEDRADDATQVLVEAHVLRESLLALCDEMQRAMKTVHARLEALPFTERDNPHRFDDAGDDEVGGASVIQISGGQEIS